MIVIVLVRREEGRTLEFDIAVNETDGMHPSYGFTQFAKHAS